MVERAPVNWDSTVHEPNHFRAGIGLSSKGATATVLLVRVFKGPPVGQHRHVELVDIAPHGDVQAAARRERAELVDLGHQGSPDPARLPRAGHVRDRNVAHLVLAVFACQPTEQPLGECRREVGRLPADEFGPE